MAGLGLLRRGGFTYLSHIYHVSNSTNFYLPPVDFVKCKDHPVWQPNSRQPACGKIQWEKDLGWILQARLYQRVWISLKDDNSQIGPKMDWILQKSLVHIGFCDSVWHTWLEHHTHTRAPLQLVWHKDMMSLNWWFWIRFHEACHRIKMDILQMDWFSNEPSKAKIDHQHRQDWRWLKYCTSSPQPCRPCHPSEPWSWPWSIWF